MHTIHDAHCHSTHHSRYNSKNVCRCRSTLQWLMQLIFFFCFHFVCLIYNSCCPIVETIFCISDRNGTFQEIVFFATLQYFIRIVIHKIFVQRSSYSEFRNREMQIVKWQQTFLSFSVILWVEYLDGIHDWKIFCQHKTFLNLTHSEEKTVRKCQSPISKSTCEIF